MNNMFDWLFANDLISCEGISPKVAAAFNATFSKQYPDLYQVAKKHLEASTRSYRRYGRLMLTFIHFDDEQPYPLPFMDAYLKAPTPAQLLADIAYMLARHYPHLCDDSAVVRTRTLEQGQLALEDVHV